MIIPTCSNISNIFDGSKKAYIYIWVSEKQKCMYIGETNDRRGTLGRAIGHLGSKGTLRQRVEERLGVRLESIDDFVLYTFPLPREDRYLGLESSYRQSIEYHVQIRLLEERGKRIPKYKIISNVKASHRNNELITKEIAECIFNGFIKLNENVTTI